jgi:hypothetical protein
MDNSKYELLDNSSRNICEIILLWISVILFISSMSVFAKADTLQHLLIRDDIDYEQTVLNNLDREAAGYAILNDPNYYCVAYYSQDEPSSRTDKLSIALLIKDRNQWIQRDFEFKDLFSDNPYLISGSIVRISYSENYFYLDTHINPSAGYLILLTKDLIFAGGLCGWLKAITDDEMIIYHNNQINFAPTHYTELSLYNPDTKADRKIYPMKPYQQVRLNHIKKVKTAYDKRGVNWFRIHNHHMNPELFNNYLSGNIAVNNLGHSVAFIVVYDNAGYMGDEDVLKLNVFRELRKQMELKEIGYPLAEELFMSLYEDLMRAKRLYSQDAVMNLFREDKELQMMITAVLNSNGKGLRENCKKYMTSLNTNWDKIEYWQNLAKIIKLQEDKYTKLLYLYRKINNTETIEYKEILLEEAKSKYGDMVLSRFLEPALLQSIFDN